jgi:NAD(P)-dependent dehydrogenase (short-subunit alcohol dehydrogenase family)
MTKVTGNGSKVAIITGGGSGLGLAIATKFVENNIITIITGRDATKLEAAKSSLGELCIPRTLDMTQCQTIPAFVDDIIRQFGKVDILVNNAGINLKKDMLDVSEEEFDKIFKTNVLGVFSMTKAVAKPMIQSGNGSIINISSMAAHYGIPKVIAYTASKSAVEGMTRSMAVELSPLGIRVNCIAPGFIETKMSAAALNNDPDRKNRVLSRTPMGKLGLPADVANACYFLSTDEARFITGTILPVDGGNSIGF